VALGARDTWGDLHSFADLGSPQMRTVLGGFRPGMRWRLGSSGAGGCTGVSARPALPTSPAAWVTPGWAEPLWAVPFLLLARA
jgi:hypothetical protein